MSLIDLLSPRAAAIEPFRVMDILARAREMEARGRSIIHMEVGEPDFTTPAPIVAAGERALARGFTRYTPALGLTELRRAIAAHYRERCGVDLPYRRVAVTPGASGALLLAAALLVRPGGHVLIAAPGYPCNRHFVRLMEGRAVGIPVAAATGYQLTPQLIAAHWSEATAAVLIASPANPTGAVTGRRELADIAACVRGLGGALIVDEIYQGLTYGGPADSVLSVSDDAFVVNSFSKYFGMTGWRVGWLAAPEAFMPYVDRLAQNIYLAAPTVAQHAACTALDPQTRGELERRRLAFQRRRDFLVPALRGLGFTISVEPQGAFYVYAGCEGICDDSEVFARELLDQAGVAITPGVDFGGDGARRHVRFAYTTEVAQLEEGVARIEEFLRR